jgi:hypothetical protein
MIIPSFIQEIVEADIEVGLRKGGKFHIGGFYKSGGITLECDGNCWKAVARYNEITTIETLHDIVGLNYHWWLRSVGTEQQNIIAHYGLTEMDRAVDAAMSKAKTK